MTLTLVPNQSLSENLYDKIWDAQRILEETVDLHLGDKHALVAKAVLFSGGNDSSTLVDLMVRLGVATHAIHANTTIGIEGTRQFVRDRCAALGLPLMEETPPKSFRDLVLEDGFPGPAKHYKMYQRLKERGLRQARRKLVTNPRKQRVLFIAGRRRAESARRSDIPENERIGSTIWASPIANWTKEDLKEYREVFNVPRNTIADALGMSGECLCGAFAEPGELERIGHHHPEVVTEIQDLEVDLLAQNSERMAQYREKLAEGMSNVRSLRGMKAMEEAKAIQKTIIPEERCMWGWGAYRGDEQPSKSGPLCSSCDFRSDPAKRAALTEEQQSNVSDAFARIQARRAAREQEQAA
jgi:3'-phosphoadenosine 5'-phosphosulfate sulfotransferase (PAPS reductase)/FAD synthetase